MLRTISKKIFQDKEGNIVIFQRPNVPILVWGISTIAARLSHGDMRHWFQLLATLALTIWALLEVGWGANYFRRTLGAIVVIFMLVTRLTS